MKLPHRRQFLHLAAGATALPVVSRAASAQAYPTRPVRWIVAVGPGSSPDIVARLVGQRLSERLGQPIIVENRPGAGANIGAQAVVNAPPDGYTLSLSPTPTRSTRRSTTNSISISSATLRRSAPSSAFPCHACESIGSRQDRSRVHRLCHGQSGQAHHGVGWHRDRSHVAAELFKRMTGVNVLTCLIAARPRSLI